MLTATNVLPSTKKCSKCLDIKLLNDFYPSRKNYLGRDSLCILCRKKHYRRLSELSHIVSTKTCPDMKVCRQCKIDKPINSFYRNSVTKDGRRAMCTDCMKTKNYSNNSYNNKLLTMYGISEENYQSLIQKQGGVCAICQTITEVKNKKRNLYIDHDHKTGKVRGLLCYRCNTALGGIRDNVDIALGLVDYLKKSEEIIPC